MILKQVIHYKDTNSVEATWVDENGVVVKCHSYADVQMDMLRYDLGDGASEYEAMIMEVESIIVPPTPKTPEQIKNEILTAVQARLDSQAQSKGYDSILSATSYTGYPNDFQLEGIAFGTWRANVWKCCYQQLAEIESGERPIIPTVDEFIAELPTL